MKFTVALLATLLLAGCGSYSAFRDAPARYTDFVVGDTYVFVRDVHLMEYDYKLIPLIKPGLQLVDPEAFRASELAPGFRIIGRAQAGDRIRVTGFDPDGGWIPSKGIFHMPNPVGVILDGELRGRKVGISMLCAEEPRQIDYGDGIMYFATANPKILKRKEANQSAQPSRGKTPRG